MKYVSKLNELGLVSWPVLKYGYENSWGKKNDLISFADLVLSNNFDENVALISANLFESELEFKSALDRVVDSSPYDDLVVNKWRLCILSALYESDKSDEEKIRNLQDVYSAFDYPEDMVNCSIYSSGHMDPLEAMLQVKEKLEYEIFCEK